MSDEGSDDSQKTEEPTSKKLDDARKRGQVVLSREVNNFIMLFAGAMIVLTIGPSVFGNLQDHLTGFIEHPEKIPTDPVGLKNVLVELFSDVAIIIFLPIAIMFVAAIAGPLAQVGPLLTYSTIEPKLEKI